MKKITILIICTLTAISIQAQQLNVSGRVLDEQNLPIQGASVTEEGTRNFALTDSNGMYSIATSNGKTLIFSFIGMKDVKETASRSIIDVVMEPDALTIEQTVVVAYGSQRRSDLASSVASLKNEELAEAPVYSVEQAIQGKMAGVRMSIASGVPGTNVVARVRGASSFSAGNDPLYVIDGVPINSSTISFVNYGMENLSPIADLNPADIASVEVLKDAAASALYGSRATNGVILITTKKGSSNQSKIEFDAYYGIQSFVDKVKFTDAKTWLEIQNEARTNYNTDNGLISGDRGFISAVGDPNSPLADVDWIDEVTRSNAAVQNYQLSFSGGNEKTRSYLSLGYFNQDGLIKGNTYEKYNIRANVDHQIKSYLKVGTNISGAYMETDRVQGSNNIYSVWSNALQQRPDEPIYNADGSYYVTTTNNPVQTINETSYNTRRVRLLGNVYALVDIFEGLTFKSQVGTDMSFLTEQVYENSKSIQGKSSSGAATDGRSWMQQFTIENFFTYTKNLNKLNMEFLAGQSYQKSTSDYNYVAGQNFASDNLRYLASAAEITGGSSSWSGNSLLSYFARTKFMFLDKYILEASIRTDGSSKFASGNRYGTFPSVAGAWIIDRESFFPQNNVLTNLKLRSSYGLTGNQEGIGSFVFRDQLASASYNDIPGFAVTSKSNPDLKWEKTRQFNVGLDFGFWNHRISLTADYYNKTTVDLLMTRTLTSTSGFSSMTDNIGSLRNQGFEFAITSRNLTGKLSWTTSLNFTHEKNEILELTKTTDGEWMEVAAGWNQVRAVGHNINSYYLLVADGIYQNKEEIPTTLWNEGVRPGDVRYIDKNNDGYITEADRFILRSPEPKLYGGFDNYFSYKDFDLSISTYFSLGGKVYAMWAAEDGCANLGRSLTSITKDVADDRWTGEGTSNSVPRAIYGTQGTWNTQNSTRFYEDVSFLKVKDITLGYSLPKSLVNRLGMQKLRVYVKAQNLLTFTNYSGYDPEVLSASTSTVVGADQGTQPQPRSFLFGLNITL